MVNNKNKAILGLVAVLLFLGMLNFVAQNFYKRLDLTAEKRYTLSPSTKALLNGLEDYVYIKIYLEGDFPAGFKRLQRSTKELLDEFKAVSGKRIEYEFIDPTAIKDMEDRKKAYDFLVQSGIEPTNLQVKGGEGVAQKIIFPGALVSYRGKAAAVQLLENQIGFGPEQVLNNSIELLEYKFANQIKKLIQRRNPKIAFTQGHGEPGEAALSDMVKTLQAQRYDVEVVDVSQQLSLADKYNVLIVTQPTQRFEEVDKYKIDQFIMHGGSVLWLIDPMNVNLDSLRGKPAYFAKPRDLNLDDMLFRYGVRLNTDLVNDMRCGKIPLVVGSVGGAPQTQLFPWYYKPLVTSDNLHSISRNLDAVAFNFCSTIDTVKNKEVRKTILLNTSQYSKALMAPVRVHFSQVKLQPDPRAFPQSHLPLAVLLEGAFESVFKNRLAEQTLKVIDSLEEFSFKGKTNFGKMIVIGDGDIIQSQVNAQGNVYPLGFDIYTEQTFANKDFLLNCIEYLLDENQLIETRNKEIRLRLLDPQKTQTEKTYWQVLNLVLPLLIILIFGLIYFFWRKRKYAV